jgi:hypothetical protein
MKVIDYNNARWKPEINVFVFFLWFPQKSDVYFPALK